jgi:hypothetical protein
MKTKILFATALLMVSSITSADTFSNLLNDIPKNISTVEKTGTCDANLDNTGIVDDKCEPVIAQCPKGKTILPGVSKCEISFLDEKVEEMRKMGMSPVMERKDDQFDLVGNSLRCNVKIPYYPDGDGVTSDDVEIKAIAKCISTPPNLLNNVTKKLGITIK